MESERGINCIKNAFSSVIKIAAIFYHSHNDVDDDNAV
jgi:hypothetical protein